MESIVVEKNFIEFVDVNADNSAMSTDQKLYCELCHYSTLNRREFRAHLLSKKHIMEETQFMDYE